MEKIEATGISKSFGEVQAVRNLSFRVEEGTIYGILGVNGSGKTTTAGKLASHLKSRGKTVMLGAADTFRAAAVEQLTIWSERASVPIIKHQDGADPAAVAYDAADAAQARGIDCLLIDTAGRLHTKVNLMEELKKIQRVVGKRGVNPSPSPAPPACA